MENQRERAQEQARHMGEVAHDQLRDKTRKAGETARKAADTVTFLGEKVMNWIRDWLAWITRTELFDEFLDTTRYVASIPGFAFLGYLFATFFTTASVGLVIVSIIVGVLAAIGVFFFAPTITFIAAICLIGVVCSRGFRVVCRWFMGGVTHQGTQGNRE
ncbi:uncharacterized protein VTP21DRAFT_105 [Calcarisporiella thermophila]|uniref:uncharacterized protein n=1 Tax=Calcarisporiella thermophila TaxID=911321 RepID=UPI0037434A27